ncbi:MAG: two-component system, OmpR family, sensor kinase [Thermoleophilaceae bacterium]|nr:two-component system, OmpR family, sensor kinase [Thermoleophilaceae bacterium]
MTRLRKLELAWVGFVCANVVAMWLWPRWETIPFHLIWLTLTLLYGFTVWRPRLTFGVLAWIATLSGALILEDVHQGTQVWGELVEVPLMSAMFLAMVWHARRRQDAMRALAEEAEQRALLLERQEGFLHDVSHELRTPITIARGHLELAERAYGSKPEIAVAVDELGRMERIVERLLMLAKAQADTLAIGEIELSGLLEDVVMRWSDVAPRVWRVGDLADGTLRADPDALRGALDALVENAVQHTDAADVIEVRSRAAAGTVSIEVDDEGTGMPPEAAERIFGRFARADVARSRGDGGVGLGLAIVDAIARAHGGRCTVSTSAHGSTFTLVLPGFRERQAVPAPPTVATGERSPVAEVAGAD